MNPFAPPSDRPRIPDAEVPWLYRYWRTRQLYSTFIGYAVFYFVRKNIPVAMPLMEKSLGVTKVEMGKFLSVHDVLYGISKFLNGIVADRANPRLLMTVGLALSAMANLAFGWGSTLVTFSAWWILNGWFQGMGFPPCARILSHWFSPSERGTKWAMWNTSHQVGAAGVLILTGWLGDEFHDWRLLFLVPAGLALVTCVFLAERLRDTPGSLGLPPVLEWKDGVCEPPAAARKSSNFGSLLWSRVFSNPLVWVVCLANFFLYIVRYSFLNWAPTFLHDAKQLSLTEAGTITAAFEVAGIPGALLAGWLTDRYTRGRRAPMCVLYMLGAAAAVWAFGRVPEHQPVAATLAMCAVGFSVYGPQFLVGVMTADLVGKEAAASAIGLTGFFGYLSGIPSGWGQAVLVQRYGWGASFQLLILCSVAAAVLFACCWGAKARLEGTDSPVREAGSTL